MARPVIDATFWVIVAVVCALLALAWWRGGGDLVARGLGQGGGLLVRFGAVIVLSFLAAGLAEVLLPREWVRGALGDEAGARAIWVGAAAGLVTPSGPFVSMPLAAAMLRTGASSAAVVAFLSAWALLSIHRLVAWEVPILGWRFALLRYAVCLGLPLFAGFGVRLLGR
ncbi:MAG: hypothetical protein MJE66_03780 [Proteobacteria bacterium]|nr:hypothetical protein [Pseudomonadota bacterium]